MINNGASVRNPPVPNEDAGRGLRSVGYFATIIVNLIVLAIAHSLPSWGVPFLTPAFVAVLPALDLSLSATIVANALFLAYDARPFREGVQIILNALALNVAVALLRVFPFDFSEPFADTLARLTIGAIIIALIIALVVGIVGWLVGLGRNTP